MAARLLLVGLAVAELGPSFAALQFKRRTLLGANCATCRLTLLAAPLLVLGQVGRILFPFCEKLPVPAAIRSLVAGPHACWVGALVFAIAMWLWHEPALYDATFQSTLVYWTMHISMIGAAVLFWDAAFLSQGFLAGSLFSIFATMLQMSLLGAILTFARTPLFSVHALTTLPWTCHLGGPTAWRSDNVGDRRGNSRRLGHFCPSAQRQGER